MHSLLVWKGCPCPAWHARAGDVAPTRFVSALASDLGMDERRAVEAVCALVAGEARNRLVEVSEALRRAAAK